MIGQDIKVRVVDSGAIIHYLQPAGEEFELNCAGSLSVQTCISCIWNHRLIL